MSGRVYEQIAPCDRGEAPDEGAQLLVAIEEFIQRFVVISAAQATAVALWVLHTHVFEVFEASPYLGITSAEKQSGKTRLLSVLELLCARPWRVISPTEAVVYRKIQAESPTLLLDEVDAIFGRGREQEPLRALLNAGNQPGTKVPRCAGPRRDRLEEYSVFCPKGMAGIGKLPDTIADRAIDIRMKRRSSNESAERFRQRFAKPEAELLRERLAAWCEQHAEALRIAEPSIPDELDDRPADSWEPLLAIADHAGGTWPQRARSAALELSGGRDREDSSRGVKLLGEIRRLFAEGPEDRLTTRALIQRLARDEESPWATWWDVNDGKPEKGAPQKLAVLLRPFEIRSRSIKLSDGNTAKGYKREWFSDVFARYLPPADSGGAVTSGTSASVSGSAALIETSREIAGDGFNWTTNAHGSADVTEVTDSGVASHPDPNEAAVLADIQALVDAGATLRDAKEKDLDRDWIELGPGLSVDAGCYPAPCPHRSHRATDWLTPERELACGICDPPTPPSISPERLPGFDW